MKPLRPYQQYALETGRNEFRAGKRSIMFVGPCGMGKTRLGAEFVINATNRGNKVLWIAHRKELLTQARDAILAEGVPRIGVICAALPNLRDDSAPVQIASIQTLLARDGSPPADMLVIDECHHAVAETFFQLAEKYTSALRIGLTATPMRADKTGMGDLFDSLVVVTSIRELTELGFLVQCRVVGPERFQANGSLSRDPVEAWLEYAKGERTVVFARNVEHSKELCEAFKIAGVRAEHVDGGTPGDIRDRILYDFKRGLIDVLCNCNILTEGFDAPGASCCVLARGCGAVSTFLQMVGRVLRPAPGKDKAILIDLPGIVHVHGMPDEEREYNLEGDPIKSKKISLRTCPQCAAVFLPAPICPQCGFVFPVLETRPFITGDALRVLTRCDVNNVAQRESYQRLVDSATERGYKPGWAYHQFVTRYGMKPPFAWSNR